MSKAYVLINWAEALNTFAAELTATRRQHKRECEAALFLTTGAVFLF